MLFSARISATIAVAAARELFEAGWRTPQKMLDSTWQQRVDALGRAGYRRYDFSTSTKLQELAEMVLEQYGGDLRRIRPSGPNAQKDLAKVIESVPRIGPTGARIFCREIQDVWPEVSPYVDERALKPAVQLGLPTDPTGWPSSHRAAGSPCSPPRWCASSHPGEHPIARAQRHRLTAHRDHGSAGPDRHTVELSSTRCEEPRGATSTPMPDDRPAITEATALSIRRRST